MDNATHRGVVAAVTGETVAGGDFVVFGPDAFGGAGWCDAHAATPTRRVANTPIAFDMGALSQRVACQRRRPTISVGGYRLLGSTADDIDKSRPPRPAHGRTAGSRPTGPCAVVFRQRLRGRREDPRAALRFRGCDRSAPGVRCGPGKPGALLPSGRAGRTRRHPRRGHQRTGQPEWRALAGHLDRLLRIRSGADRVPRAQSQPQAVLRRGTATTGRAGRPAAYVVPPEHVTNCGGGWRGVGEPLRETGEREKRYDVSSASAARFSR